MQSVLASGPLRRTLLRLRRPAFLDQAETVLLDCGDDIRLQGFYSAQTGPSRGLVVLMHGWEGSADSSYIQESATGLYGAGFEVFRLNFRDHGQTHHLNQGLFHSCRINEVVNAVKAIGLRYPGRPLLLAGYSLGGNFALRVACAAPAAGIVLQHAMAVCPPVSPKHSLEAIATAPWIYEHYFLKKWRNSLRLKQQLFPDDYAVDNWLKLDLLGTTARLVEQFTEFSTAEDYFDGYSVADDRLSQTQIPTTILAATDDPVIPIKQFHELKLAPNCQLQITEHGGHCGFLHNWRLESWVSTHITRTMLRAIDQLEPASASEQSPLTAEQV